MENENAPRATNIILDRIEDAIGRLDYIAMTAQNIQERLLGQVVTPVVTKPDGAQQPPVADNFLSAMDDKLRRLGLLVERLAETTQTIDGRF